MITLIDYGLGNLRSVQKAFEMIEIDVKISSEPSKILNAEKLVLPGVGHFKSGINNLRKMNLFDVLNEAVLIKKTPILGICLGMQLMTQHSEEGDCQGFGWLSAQTKKFENKVENKLKIPHMGWNNIRFLKNSILARGIEETDMFYFVHSYYVNCIEESHILTSTDYIINFHSSFESDNILGVQFHPEKSYKPGLTLLKNYCEL